MRKVMESTKFHSLGWKPTISLEEGLKLTYQDYCSSLEKGNTYYRSPKTSF